MHFPFTIDIAGTRILLHTILEPLGMFAGFRYFLFLRKKQGDPIQNTHRTWVLIGAIFGALIGSRLAGGLENPPALLRAANPLLYCYQQKTVVGGFLGGLAGVELIKKLIGEKTSSGDLFTYPMLLALLIGRIGCFSMGVYEETYGTPTSLFTGIDLGDGLLRHPVCLYEIAFLILVWVGLRRLESRTALAPGGRFKIFMIAYLVFRLLLDFIKPHYTWPIGLSSLQLICLAGLVYYYRYLVRPKNLTLPHHA